MRLKLAVAVVLAILASLLIYLAVNMALRHFDAKPTADVITVAPGTQPTR